MELLPEFLFTVGFCLFVAFLVSFVLPVVFSLCPSRDVNGHVGKKRVECRVEPEILDWGSRFDEKVDEFIGKESREGNLVAQDFKDESFGSPEGHEGSRNDEYEASMDVGVVCLQEKCVGEERFCGDGLDGGIFQVVDESPEGDENGELEVGLRENEVGVSESEEMIEGSGCDGNDHESDGGKESLVDYGLEKEKGLFFQEEDDWEGIERTELERLFGAAVAFLGSKSNADRVSRVGSDVKMRLDGLHKIATRGPCFEPQPMAFKVSARAKCLVEHEVNSAAAKLIEENDLHYARNAWQQLGNMSAEMAMEQYIALLSERVPGWMQDVHCDFADAQVLEKVASDLKTLEQNQSGAAEDRKVEELKSDVEGLDETRVGALTH